MRLVSHPLCPYVQRAAIVAAEKGIALEREDVDLSAKPDWFLRLSPTGKVPLLLVDGTALFESAPIAEFLDEMSGGGLLPADLLRRARHRAWVEFASATLSDIAGLYAARDEAGFEARRRALGECFREAEAALAGPPSDAAWFEGESFGLADAAWGPVFRYLDAFERLAGLFLADGLPKVAAWRAALAARPSVAGAVGTDYPARLEAFLLARGSWLSGLIGGRAAA